MSKAKQPTHEWLVDRNMTEPSIVMRIDDYSMTPVSRGQFYPELSRFDDCQKAIWPNRERACRAAEWAAKKFGHVYAVFVMVGIVEQAEPPLKVTVI
jgi:hypothetical protein